MKKFPGIETNDERKKFAIFHACSLLICLILSAAILCFQHRDPFGDSKNVWLFTSILFWNFLGSWRFHSDLSEDGGFFIGRLATIVLVVGFPLLYLHNLWCIITKKE